MTVQRERFVRENAPKQREAKWFDQAALGQTSANGHGDRHAHMHQYTKTPKCTNCVKHPHGAEVPGLVLTSSQANTNTLHSLG